MGIMDSTIVGGKKQLLKQQQKQKLQQQQQKQQRKQLQQMQQQQKKTCMGGSTSAFGMANFGERSIMAQTAGQAELPKVNGGKKTLVDGIVPIALVAANNVVRKNKTLKSLQKS